MSDEAVRRFQEGLMAEARLWNGAPFRFKGYTRRGADCVGCIVGLLRRRGARLPDDDGDLYEPEWYLHDKRRNRYLEGWPKFGRIVKGLGLDMALVPDEEPERPGDVVCIWNLAYRKVTHSGLYLGNGLVIHAHRHDHGVKIIALATPWLKRSAQSWIRLRAVEEAVDGR